MAVAKPRVYVETSIPSFYVEGRTAPDVVVRREWTRQWWAGAPKRYELVTSTAVLDELTGDVPELSAQRLAVVHGRPPWNSLEVAMKPSESDPVIDEIREVRHRISARFDHDPGRLVAYYIELQRRYQDRLIQAEKPPNAIPTG